MAPDPDPNPLDPERLTSLLTTRQIARSLIVFATIDSTNQYALSLPDAEAVHGFAAVAEFQSAGRGRFRRHWQAPRGRALLATFIVRGRRYADAVGALTMASSVAVRRTLEKAAGLRAEIRWPNDTLVAGRKICGILTEAGPWRPRPGWVVGIGLNVNQGRDEFPKDLREIATSMAAEAGRPFDRAEVFATLCAELEGVLETLAAGAAGRETIRAEWERASCLLGHIVKVQTGHETVEGMAVGLSADGGLVVRLETGILQTLRTGTAARQ
ncbi:MAG: biotin--[acetyl-CoA-carboxylase] ligase [Candidatus Sumerlaeota bacterium]|nr:biotin--[acetyl-CoA-carboxylase] ligase [Candidatus Sumerlaeota bacterium]